MVGGLGTGFVTRHEDGTVFASIEGTSQRKPYRFDPARDDDGLRSRKASQ